MLRSKKVESLNYILLCEASYVFCMQELMSFVRSYVVPEGFPHSVTPSYVPYMTWRALKVFAFTMSTTQEI